MVSPRRHNDVHGAREHQLAIYQVETPEHGRNKLQAQCYRFYGNCVGSNLASITV
jgi:hypothetical protein